MNSAGKYPHQIDRRPVRAALMRAVWILGAAGVLWLLFSLPYDILRNERLRAFGEVETRGLVRSKAEIQADDGQTLYMIQYMYEDESGLLRQAEAPFPPDIYEVLEPGDRITVYFARVEPTIVRVNGQIEPWLQDRLRKFLGP